MTAKVGTGQKTKALDGRRARRERGRAAVTEAMIDLVFDGHLPPTVEQVAERSGVSVASIFRYFETLDDLRRATTDLYFERFVESPDLDVGHGDFNSRVASFTASRANLYQTSEPMAQFLRLRATQDTLANEFLHRARVTRAEQIRKHFDVELSTMTTASRGDMVAVVATLTSFEAWEQARYDHERSPMQLRRAWTTALTKLLSP